MCSSANARDDGLPKVRGRAGYVDDLRPADIGFDFLHAVVVTSTIAKGRVASIDADATLAMPGVRAVVTHRNAPRLSKIVSIGMGEIAEFLPLQDDRVRYFGQCVAIVVADSLYAAREGARRLSVTYVPDPDAPIVALADADAIVRNVKRAGIAPGTIAKGRASEDYEDAPVRIDLQVRNAPHHHNALEIGAAIARWDPDGGVTVHAAVQWHHHEVLAIGRAFGLGMRDGFAGFLARAALGVEIAGKVRLVNAPAGGAFGRNINMVHVLLACMAAKVVGHAVKVVLTREQTFTLLSHRGEVRQRVRLGASRDGRLRAQIQDPDIAVGAAGAYVEPVGNWPLHVYAHESHRLVHRVARLDSSAAGWMRGPGGSSGLFALETAMDELAREIGMDPLDLRLANFAAKDPQTNKPWTSNELRACYDAGAAAFGWRERPPGGLREADGRLVGTGMATAFEPHFRFPATARLTLDREGRCLVECTAAEMGQGLTTGLRTIAAQSMGLDRAAIALRFETTDLPYGAGSVAATGAYSNGASIHEAARRVRAKLFAFAVSDPESPLHGYDPGSLSIENGIVVASGNARESVAALMRRYPKPTIVEKVTTGRTFGMGKAVKASFGAIFARVSLDPITLDLRVERLVGAYDCGRILEPRIARAQVVGGMIWGLGQALMEETRVDRVAGRWSNAELGEALVPTCADIPPIDVVFVPSGEPDPSSPSSMKSLSELGVYGTPAAIANAVRDATGWRPLSLPLRIEDRIAALSRHATGAPSLA